MKYFSMFSGVGGFEKAIKDVTDWECVGFSEIDKFAIQVYNKHFEGHKNYGDATKINPKELPDFDLLLGGFPCQSFSVAGNRLGFDDTRGTMFFEIARIIEQKRPRFLLLENVKGLLSHDSGKTFETILRTLDELGYDAEWQVLNSADFGVPQNRRRVFIIGYPRGQSRPEVFPIMGNARKTLKELTVNTSQAMRIYDTAGLSSTIISQGGGLGAKTGLYLSKIDRKTKKYFIKEVDKTGTIVSSMWKGADRRGNTVVMCRPVLTPDRAKKRQNGRRFKGDGEPSFTLTAQDRHGVYDGYKIRRLTPLECERLQGFPDNWTEGLSDTQRYKCIGNAVTVNVIKAILKKLTLSIKKEKDE